MSSVSKFVIQQHFITCSICGREVKDLTYTGANELMKEHFLYWHTSQKYQAVISYVFTCLV